MVKAPTGMDVNLVQMQGGGTVTGYNAGADYAALADFKRIAASENLRMSQALSIEMARYDEAKGLEEFRKFQEETADMLYNPQSGYFNKTGKHALEAYEPFNQRYEERAKEYQSRLSGRALEQFNNLAHNYNMQIKPNVQRHVTKNRNLYEAEERQGVINNHLEMARMSASTDPAQSKASLDTARALLIQDAEKMGLPEYAIAWKVKEFSSQHHAKTFQTIAQQNPAMAVAYIQENQFEMMEEHLVKIRPILQEAQSKAQINSFLGQVDKANQSVQRVAITPAKQSMIDFVMVSLEGEQLAMDSNGYQVRYGINKKYNPDVDLENLTREEAQAVLDSRYWQKAGIDQLKDPKAQLAAFAFFMNSDQQVAKRIIEESGGDFDKMLDMQEAFYERLAEKHPEKHGKSLKGWKGRLNKIRAMGAKMDEQNIAAQQAGVEEGLPPHPLLINPMIPKMEVYKAAVAAGMDNEAAIKVTTQYGKQYDMMEQQRKAQLNEVKSTLIGKVSMADGDLSVLSAEETATAKQLGFYDKLQKMETKKQSDPATLQELSTLPREELAKRNLSEDYPNLSIADYRYFKSQQEAIKGEGQNPLANIKHKAMKDAWGRHLASITDEVNRAKEQSKFATYATNFYALYDSQFPDGKMPTLEGLASVEALAAMPTEQPSGGFWSRTTERPLAAQVGSGAKTLRSDAGIFKGLSIEDAAIIAKVNKVPITEDYMATLSKNPLQTLGLPASEITNSDAKEAIKVLVKEGRLEEITHDGVLLQIMKNKGSKK